MYYLQTCTRVSYFEIYTKNQIKAVKAFLFNKKNMEHVLRKISWWKPLIRNVITYPLKSVTY